MESTQILLTSIDTSVSRLGDIILGENGAGVSTTEDDDVTISRAIFDKINHLRLNDPIAYRLLVENARSLKHAENL